MTVNNYYFDTLALVLLELGILVAGTFLAYKLNNLTIFGGTLASMVIIWIFS